jgi:hypothetical protein
MVVPPAMLELVPLLTVLLYPDDKIPAPPAPIVIVIAEPIVTA